MNNRTLARARDALYARASRLIVESLARLFGLPVTPESIQTARSATQPIVTRTRESVRGMVYRDYVQVIENDDPVPPLELHRFTDELWTASIEKAVEGLDEFDTEAIEQIALSADYWSRDAEWGQAVDVAKNDDRVGRIARVDPIPPTCPLCTMLNSRGPVYLSEDSFARTLHTGDTCEPVFVPKGSDEYPGMEHTEIAKKRYKDAVKAAPNGSADAILKALRDQEPDRPAGRVRKRVTSDVESVKRAETARVRAVIASLESKNPTTESAIRLKDQQIERNKKILSALEAN